MEIYTPESFNAKMLDLGFQSWAYFSLGKPLIQTTYPDEWVQRYADENYRDIDPVIPASMASITPFHWSSADGKHKGKRRRFFAEARDFGIERGVSLPVHAPNGCSAVITVASPEKDQAFKRHIDSILADLHFAAVAYHESRWIDDSQPRPVNLTPREIECLKWSAIGKTSWEIGCILNISRNTVNQYFDSAKTKLNATTRTHAVVIAIMRGHIQL